MIRIRKSEERGQADHGWLKTHYTFSFADYHDPQHMGFRSLRVINDDVVAGGGGFPTHSHRDMEIITYVLSGALEHKDSMGNGSVIRPGHVQYMAAGTGVQHSEFNHSPTEPVHLLQIWIQPDTRGAKPGYAERSFSDAPSGTLTLIASKAGRDGSIAINQDANVFVGKLAAGNTVTHTLGEARGAWLHVAEGEVMLNGQPLKTGDGAALTAEKVIELRANQPSQVLIFDLG
ncbi:MAG TPA: pirin family protein [Methylomirabilota bacterium]|nr:pirin family protein [Methylomirabilota bacterium]